MDPEQRRRAQSKSPARAAKSGGGGGNAEPSQNPGISKRFREFSDAVRQRMGGGGGSKGKSQSQQDVVDSARAPAGPLKSNLKKNLSSEGELRHSHHAEAAVNDSDSNDNRKVHFNKFATVQMME